MKAEQILNQGLVDAAGGERELRIAQLEDEIERLRAALAGLVDRLDFVHDDPAFRSVWMINQLHTGPYCGPTYSDALEAARTVLSHEQKAPSKSESGTVTGSDLEQS